MQAAYEEVVGEAARMKTVAKRTELLDDNGLTINDFKFDGKGGWTENFGLSSLHLRHLDWLRASVQDLMHTGIIGPATLESGFQSHVHLTRTTLQGTLHGGYCHVLR